jgi:hypothetical protein
MINQTAQFADELQGNNEMRHAALFLHGQVKEDQDWLLAQLSGEQRAQLSVLVDELRTIGMPSVMPDSVIVPQKSVPDMDAIRFDIDVRTCSPIEYLDQVPVKFILSALSTENLETIAFFLKSAPWSWLNEFVETFDPMRRFQLKEKLKGLSVDELALAASMPKKTQESLLIIVSDIVRELDSKRHIVLDETNERNQDSRSTWFARIKKRCSNFGTNWSAK